MKRYVEAAHKAAHDTARYMTADIRHSALEHGWHPDVVSNTKVHYEEGKFNVKVHNGYGDDAFRHEFGDEENRPTAVVRKYANNTHQAQRAFLMSAWKHLGGKL